MKIKQIKDLINRIKKSNEGKTVIANFGYLSLLQIAGYAFPLITMPYLARVIGADGFGKIAFASAVIVWIQTISDWGFTFTATRDVAQNKDNKDTVSQIFSNVLWARLFLTIISGTILLLAIIFVPFIKENADIILVTFLMVPGHILFPEWFFQAIEKMKYTTIFNIIIKLLFTIAVFAFIHHRSDYILQPIITTIGYLVCGIGAMYLILYKWGFRLHKPQWNRILQTIKSSTDVFLNNLMPNLYNSFSVMLLGMWGGVNANGLFDGGNKFPNIFYNLQLVLSRAFFPFLSRRIDKHKVFCRINLGTAIIGATLLIILSPWIVRIILGDEFESSIIVMQILSVSIVFLALSNTYGTNYLIIKHKEKQLRDLTFVSSIVGMISAFPLVYFYSYIGAALTILLSRTLLGVLSYLVARKY